MLRVALLLSFCVGMSVPAAAREPWADAALPVEPGLLLWLDAGVQPEAWKQAATRGVPLADGRPVDLWFDGSGQRRHLLQRAADAQPTFRQFDKFSVVRFDGENDYLAHSEAGRSVEEFTLFVFVAPRSNAGFFRAVLGASAFGQNDYTSGFNLDQSGSPSAAFQVVNVEGAGFGGARDLLADSYPFGEFRMIEVTADAAAVRVIVDGKTPGESRPREKRRLALDELIVGARLFSNEPRPVYVQGFLDGDIAEILLYDRALADAERNQVRDYLLKKYAEINQHAAHLDDAPGHLLKTVDDPPAVQMFVPGFDVRKLPLELPNINNLLYRADGALVALGYDGSIFLLRDTDGDGLEDRADPFWENRGQLQAPIGMDLTPEGSPHGRGVFVASKGKCSLIVDTDGDDRADREIVVAEGWTSVTHGVDALGVAVDPKDGSVYFGLGTQSFTDAYLVDSQGNAQYRLQGERGTILRVAPDFQSREIVCTGIRFPVALRFNARGDLFCTDQEGATWLPNGNPFDELLHIQPGRHYGFPPRHPKHLPRVIDEPSTFDYVPQHQSTCGLNFNLPQRGGKVFGPDWWRGDALVAGYSRGKLYRTQLVPTETGYVAQNHLLAALNALTVDACVSPAGDLVVATHSGGPDWGSGPAGKGALYKVTYRDRETAQPVLAWPASEREVHVVFDRPIDLDDARGLAESLRIEHSPWTSAGDRFETLRPGYAVVQMQMATRRYDLPVLGVQVTPDRRTLVISTDRHAGLHQYGLSLPWKSRAAAGSDAGLPQHAATDLQYSLHGVSAALHAADGTQLWDGWWPHLDPQVSEKLTVASPAHEPVWTRFDDEASRRGVSLTLETQLDLSEMLRSAVQPGSELSFQYPPETVTLVLASNRPLQVDSEGAAIERAHDPDGRHDVRIVVESPGKDFIPLRVTLGDLSGPDFPALTVNWHTQEDARLRPLPLRRMFLPWATRTRPDAGTENLVAKLPAELDGGSWGRGRQIFYGEKAQCAKCHRVGLHGGRIGPALTNLIHRDYASVLRDVVRPSFAINPDHLSYSILLTDGRVLTGVVAASGDTLLVGDKEGNLIEVKRADVEEMVPSNVSIMPEGIEKQLGPDAMRDLLTYLLTPPPRMPNDLPGAPDPRARVEVETILKNSETFSTPPKPLHLLLVAGRKDHGPGEHDYPAWLNAWGQLFEGAANVTVSRAMEWPTPEQFAAADAIVFYQQGTWNDQRAADLDAFLQRGGGVSYIHYAVDGGPNSLPFAERIGLAWQGGASRFRHGELDLIVESDHPIARNFTRVHFHDESYWNLQGNPREITLLASGKEENAQQPLIWCREHDRGRVFVSILGHYSWTFDDPLFRILLLRGIAWSAGESVDRFNDLATIGARVIE